MDASQSSFLVSLLLMVWCLLNAVVSLLILGGTVAIHIRRTSWFDYLVGRPTASRGDTGPPLCDLTPGVANNEGPYCCDLPSLPCFSVDWSQ